MKKIIINSCVLLSCFNVVGQQNPTASNPAGAVAGINSNQYWSRGGNTNASGTNNMFGTLWNSPIYFYTDGYAGTGTYQGSSLRMKLNGTFDTGSQYPINGFGWVQGVNGSGYLGLGYSSNGPGGNLWSNKGAFSLLHLNGRNGTFVQEGGFRPWMQAGLTLTDNQDLSYMGLRRIGTSFDVTETVMAWSDNAGTANGPDDFTFRFLGEGNGNTNINTGDLLSTGDLDGLHIARFTGTGEFGLGNTFGVNPAGTPANLYVRPASLAHYSLSNFRSVWQQFTNRNTALGSGTGENESDGLRIGIIGNANSNVNGTAAIYNQELRPLLFSTNANTTLVNVVNGTTYERFRIMSVSTPTYLASGGFGVYNPGGIGANYTRMAISYDPANPVTRPLSLLHLGYNTGLSSAPLGSTDGWRSWMDIGTFTSNGTDNMYVGLKNEGSDRADAVVSWGDNQTSGGAQGPDNLRFIFTSSTSSIINPGDPVSSSANGQEVARMHPGQASTLTNNYGMVGIGNFTSNAIDAKLDIDGDLRIRTVTQDNSLTRVLVIDPNDQNRVHYADIDMPTGGGFVECSDMSGAADLTADSKVNLNNNNLYFENNSISANRIGFGYDCSHLLSSKVNVYSQYELWNTDFYTNNSTPVACIENLCNLD